MRAGQPAQRRPVDPVLVLEAGRPDHRLDVFVQMPAALMFPIGNRFYDWKYESEPEPYLGGRRVYHARGKVLGGSSSINGMIFQRGNPLDFERWAADPGMERWDYAHCLPYFKRMEDCLAAAPTTRSAATAARWCSSAGRRRPAVRGVLRGRPAGRLPAHRRRQRIPAGGLRRVRPQPPPRPPAQRRRARTSTRCCTDPTSTCGDRALVTRLVFDGNRVIGVEYARPGRRRERVVARRGDPVRRRLQLAAAAPARRASATPSTCGRSASTCATTCPASASTCRTTSRSTSSTPARSRCRSTRAAKWRTGRGSACSGWPGAGPGASNHFEAGGFIRSNDEVAYPNLMFHFLPIAVRYDGSGPAGGHGYQVHVGPMYSDSRGSVRITLADPRVKPALRFNYLSTGAGPAGVGRGDPPRPPHPRPAGVRPVRRRRALAGPGGRDRRRDPRLGGQRRRDGAAPVVHVPDGRRRARPSSTPPRCASTACAGCASSTPRSMPYITNGNIYAPVMMLAEKAADLILGNDPAAARAGRVLPADPAAGHRQQPDDHGDRGYHQEDLVPAALMRQHRGGNSHGGADVGHA